MNLIENNDLLPLISIIIPVYNVESYVTRCVLSVEKQTYENIEIILVDDGSTDNSGRICDNLATNDVRIRVIHKNNGGLSDARNVGIENSTGEYIFFVDSDDWIEFNTIEYLYEILLKYNSDIAVCGYYDETNIEESSDDLNPQIYEYRSNLEAINGLIFDGAKIGVVVWNKLYRKELFKKIRFIYGKLNEDIFFTPKVLYYTNRMVASTKKLYHYLVSRQDSIMNKPLTRKNLDAIEAFKDNAVFFEENKMSVLADLYWFKYYGMMITMYCKFYKISKTDIAAELKENIHDEFFFIARKCIRMKNYRELVKAALFNFSSLMFYWIWRKKYDG